MKKIFLVSLLLVLMAVSVVHADQINIITDDGSLEFEDVTPYIDGANRTMIPVRVVSESFGAAVEWIGESQTVRIKDNDKTIELMIGSKDVKVDGQNIILDTQAVIKDSRTFVPVRFVAEALGKEVKWDDITRTVLILSDSNNYYGNIVKSYSESDKMLGISIYPERIKTTSYYDEKTNMAVYIIIKSQIDTGDNEAKFLSEFKDFVLDITDKESEMILNGHKIELFKYTDHISLIVYAAAHEVVEEVEKTEKEQIKWLPGKYVDVQTKNVVLPAAVDGVTVENVTFEDITINGMTFGEKYIKVIQDQPIKLELYFGTEISATPINFTLEDGSETYFFDYEGKHLAFYQYKDQVNISELKSIENIGLKVWSQDKTNLIWIDNPKGE